MAGKVVKDMHEDFLVCSICMGQFKTPKMLPCIHSFCESCLEKYSAKQDDNKQVPCPTCRKVCELPETGVKGLQTNFHLINLAERIQLLDKLTSAEKKATSCESCKSPEIVAFCADCNFAICSTCQGHHALFPVLRGHDVIPLNKLHEPKFQQEWKTSKSPYCDVHTSEKLRFFCKTCSKLVCRDCTIVVHSKHECTEAMNQYESSLEALRKLVENNEECLENGVKFVGRGDEGVKAIEAANYGLELDIDEHLNAMMTKIEKMFQEQKQSIVRDIALRPKFVEDQIQIAKGWIGRMKNTQETSRRLLDENNPWEIIAMLNDLIKASKELGEESLSLNWFKCDLRPGVLFTPSPSIPRLDIGSHGYLPDFAFSDPQGNFILCQFHSATGRIVFQKKSVGNSGIKTEKFPPCGPIKMKTSGELRACYDINNYHFFSGATVASVGHNFQGINMYTVNLQDVKRKIQYISRSSSRNRVCITDDSLEQNLMSGNFTYGNTYGKQNHTFQAETAHTLKATSPVTYTLPAQYDVLYFTETDGLNTYDWGAHRCDKKYEIDTPTNVMDIAETSVLHADCDANTTTKFSQNYGNRTFNAFTVFILWKGRPTAIGENKNGKAEAWLVKEYDTNSERVVGLLECLQGDEMAPMALYNGGKAHHSGGRQIQLCDSTGTITKYRRGKYNNTPVHYEKV